MSIEIQNVRKKFGDFAAVDDVSLTIQRGELVALLGPSGSGKTSLLRIIAGLQLPDEGRVLFDGEDLALRRVRERRVGFVFQHYALFRHMTVFENVAFGLRVMPRSSRPSREEIRTRVMDLLKLVQIEWLSNQYPAQLSGGQRQRVALARALIVQPRVLLLDEPFGALDAKVRRELRRWLRNLHNEIQVTSVFVTHDQEEALEVADRVVIMNRGRIVQSGTPEEVYDHPDSPFVFEFLGNVNLFHSRVHQGAAEIHGVRVDAPELREIQDATGTAYVRPQDFDVSRSPGEGASIEAIVRHISRAGSLVRLELQRADSSDPIEAELTHDQFLQLGAQKGERLFLSPRRVRVFTDSLTSAQL